MIEKATDSVLEVLHVLQCATQDHATVVADVVRENGYVVVPTKQACTKEDVVHDYVFFCLAKGARSLFATDMLLTNKYLEDAKILLRGVYECYLNGAFGFNRPERINELVAARVGVWGGLYEQPTTKKGKPIRGKMIHPRTKEITDVGVAVGAMARETGNPSDAVAHDYLYSFLSEFVHVHMVASGSYRSDDDRRYAIESGTLNLNSTMLLSAYISFLLADLSLYVSGSIQKLDHWKRQLANGIRYMHSCLDEADFGEGCEEIRAAMKHRLSATLNTYEMSCKENLMKERIEPPPEAMKALEDQRKRFVKKFGREPGPKDPVFFDPDEDEPVPMDPVKLRNEFSKLLESADIPKERVEELLEVLGFNE